jgi:hypothetical protein
LEIHKKLGLKENLQDDNFEEFMRNKLNEFDGEPNDNMWDRVESVIPPAPKPMLFRIIKPSVIAASMVLAVAAYAMIYQYNSTQNLNQQIIEANNKIQQLENKIDKNSNEETAQLEEFNQVEVVEQTIDNDDIQSEGDIINQNGASNLNTNRTADKNKSDVVSNSTKSYKQPSSIINNKNKASIVNDNIMNKNNGSQKQLNSNKLDKTPIANDIIINKNNGTQKQLNSNKLDKTPIANDIIINKNNGVQPKDKLQTSNEAIALSEPFLLDRIRNSQITNPNNFIIDEQKTALIKPTFKPSLIVGGFIHSFQTKPDFKERPGTPPPGGNPFRDHRVKPATGLAIGAKVGVQLNKNWSIHSGLAYQQEKIEMKLVDRNEYNNDREKDIGNNQEGYQTDYKTQSPFGEISIDGQFTKDKDDNIENKPFNIEIDGTHELTSLNIPLYVQVQDQKGRFVYGLKTGIYGRNVINNSFEATSITSSISELKSSEVTVTEQPKVSNKWTVDFLGGVILGYKPNQNLMVSVEPTALMSLRNQHESQYGGTKMKTFGSQLAVQYIF